MATTAAARARPILMGAPMVRGLRDGTKTMTRRVAKPQPDDESIVDEVRELKCPYAAGMWLWVQETWATSRAYDYLKPSELGVHCDPWYYRADGEGDEERGRWRPAIHMPRIVSRITLEILEVRLEKLRSITEADAEAEGVDAWYEHLIGRAYDEGEREARRWTEAIDPTATAVSFRGKFAALWQAINGGKPGCSWAESPWVWALTFRRVGPGA